MPDQLTLPGIAVADEPPVSVIEEQVPLPHGITLTVRLTVRWGGLDYLLKRALRSKSGRATAANGAIEIQAEGSRATG